MTSSPAYPYDSPARQVRALLLKYSARAKKSWSQNFLVDPRAYQHIVEAAAVGAGDTVLEIGAGLGTLTARLLATGAKVVAVERDREMCAVLRGELADHDRFLLREEDALQLDVAAVAAAAGGPLVLVGNLPYQIASPLLFRFLAGAARPHVRRMVLMLQREVAERLLARPDGEAYSAMSAQVQLLADVRRVCHVGPGGFLPPPRVDSTVVLVTPLLAPRVPVRDLDTYARVVRAAFGKRRKTLRNALAAAFPDPQGALRRAGVDIDLGRRGETLSVAEFARLADAFAAPAERPGHA